MGANPGRIFLFDVGFTTNASNSASVIIFADFYRSNVDLFGAFIGASGMWLMDNANKRGSKCVRSGVRLYKCVRCVQDYH